MSEIITFRVFTDPKTRRRYAELPESEKRKLLREYFLNKWSWILSQKKDLSKRWYLQFCVIVDECHYHMAITDEEHNKAKEFLKFKLNCESWRTDTSKLPIKIELSS